MRKLRLMGSSTSAEGKPTMPAGCMFGTSPPPAPCSALSPCSGPGSCLGLEAPLRASSPSPNPSSAFLSATPPPPIGSVCFAFCFLGAEAVQAHSALLQGALWFEALSLEKMVAQARGKKFKMLQRMKEGKKPAPTFPASQAPSTEDPLFPGRLRSPVGSESPALDIKGM